MPAVSRFFGIVIFMNYNDHSPPHFHARHGGERVVVEIETGAVLAGRMSPPALRRVLKWAGLRRIELLEDWRRARLNQPMLPIALLESR
jgi:Domain of unknown function (DUF4160)